MSNRDLLRLHRHPPSCEHAMDLSAKLLEMALAAPDALRLPESTYRYQLNSSFTFRDAHALVGYLADLGISHCYASSYLKARPGSTHGYDIVDHSVLNPEIGSEDDYNAWISALKERGLGQILDTVPNHMGVASNENAWWNDVLENGPASRYAAYFDISWRASPRPQLQDKVLLPMLGDPYGDVLEAGQLKLVLAGGAFAIQYYERRFPLAPCTYARVMEYRLPELETELGPEAPALLEYQSIVTASRNLPPRAESDPAKLTERWREKEVIKRRLAALMDGEEPIRRFLDRNLAEFNGTPGQPRSFNLLDDLLERQCYRLSYWRVASDEINYRRFFDNNDLAALNMERAEVFEAAHALILRLLEEGKIDGLRIDHPDGLYDPAEYFRRLQEHYVLGRARRIAASDPAFARLDWSEAEGALRELLAKAAPRPPWPLYVVAEKILLGNEPLPEDWAIYGTSGYEFLNAANGLFVAADNADAFTRIYRDWIQDGTAFSELAYQKKLVILDSSLSSELHMLTHQLDGLAQKTRKSRDFTFNTLRAALREVIACFPVYRTYISAEVHDSDCRWVDMAIRRAAARSPLISRRVFRFIRSMLLLEFPASFSEEDKAEQLRFAGKLQQVTAPVTAKGIEDTAFYVYNRLVSLNEVGGEPARFGVSVDSLHRFHQARQAKWPHAFSPLSTHDTKRSEDVRARINVLSELPEEWQAALLRWSRLNEPHRSEVDDQFAPGHNEEYLLYQTLLGAWPLEPATPAEYAEFVQRIQAYMEKALHEAKVHTSWINPNEAYDKAIHDFIAGILDEARSRPFLDDFRAFQRKISHYGLFNSLSQTLLKICAPGIPDTYQGTELWDFSLVDPDNRRPVDYERRRRMLRELKEAYTSVPDLRMLGRELTATKEDGRIKLYVTTLALSCRRDCPGLFSVGDYLPIDAVGRQAKNLFAFARRLGDAQAIVVVPRLVTGLAGSTSAPLGAAVWHDTRLKLPPAVTGQRWRHLFTGEELSVEQAADGAYLTASALFEHFPVSLVLKR